MDLSIFSDKLVSTIIDISCSVLKSLDLGLSDAKALNLDLLPVLLIRI